MTDALLGRQVEIVVVENGTSVHERTAHCVAPLGLPVARVPDLVPLLRLASSPALLTIVSLGTMRPESVSQAVAHLQDKPAIWVAPPSPHPQGAAQLPAARHLLPYDFTCNEMRGTIVQLSTLLQAQSRPAETSKSMIVHAPVMHALVAEADAFADCDQSVLIQGETGTGKELIAERLHRGHSRYGKGPFVPVNCGAVPEGLFESLFFGHEKGAFSGANHAHQGYLEQAKGGTLFLDEVGDLPRFQQVKLLRVLENNSVTPVGARKPVLLDFRVIAASNLSLRELVAKGGFRADLFYRLAVIELRIPNLEQRGVEDKVAIFQALSQQVMGPQALAAAGSAPFWVTDAVARTRFPGNVRQLRNLAERIGVIVRQTGRWDREMVQRALDQVHGVEPVVYETGARKNWNVEERNRIIETLHAHAWRRQETAAHLGISRKVLWEKMRKYQISDGEPLVDPARG